MSEQVTALLDHLLPHADDIRSLRPDFATWLVCVGHYSEYQTGGLSIDLAAIKAMAQMELALDFDFYCGHVPEGNA